MLYVYIAWCSYIPAACDIASMAGEPPPANFTPAEKLASEINTGKPVIIDETQHLIQCHLVQGLTT